MQLGSHSRPASDIRCFPVASSLPIGQLVRIIHTDGWLDGSSVKAGAIGRVDSLVIGGAVDVVFDDYGLRLAIWLGRLEPVEILELLAEASASV